MKKYHDAEVLIVVRGGVVQSVAVTGRSIKVYLVDYDNLNTGESIACADDLLFPAESRRRSTIHEILGEVVHTYQKPQIELDK